MEFNFFKAFITLALLNHAVLAQYSLSFGGNLSARVSISSVSSSPAVTASASLSQLGEQAADCNPCMIMAAWESIFRVYWYNSSIGVTLDTVSLIVTVYNNTAITRTSTVYGDLESVNVSSVAEAQSIASSLALDVNDNDYNLYVGILLGNATKGLDDAAGPPPYPTPYLAIDAFQYISLPSQADACLLAERATSYTCSCPMKSYALGWVENAADPFNTQMPSVSLTSTYYETLNYDPASNLLGDMGNDFGLLNNISVLAFLSSASAFESHPELSSCAIFQSFNGPPKVIIPALALTTTVATTVSDHGPYKSSTPQPASPIIQTQIAPQTATTLPTTKTGQAAPVPVPKPAPVAPNPSSPEVSPSSPIDPASPESLPAEEPPEQAEQQPPQGLNPVLTFGGSTYTADQSSNIVVSSQTLLPGSPAATVDSTPISIAPGGLAAVVGTSTQLLATLPSPAVLTFGGSAYTADTSSNIVLAGSTLRAGGSPVVVSGTTVSLVPGGAAAVVGTHTQVLGGLTPAQGSSNTAQNVPHAVPATPVLTFAGSTYTANAASEFVVAGQTVTPGGVINIDNTPISIAPGASLAVIGSSTQSLVGPAITPQPVLIFAGSTYTAGTSSDFLINGKTLTKGGAINIGGTELSFGQAGTYFIIGTSTQQLQTPSVTAISEPMFTFDGSTYTARSSSDFVIDGQTLIRGGIIDVHGTRLSYGHDGTEVIIGTSTQKLGTASMTVAEEPAITFDGLTYLADSASNFVIDGQTLSRGGTINVDGTQLSYGQDGTDVVIGTSTEGVGLGGYIMSGLSGGPTSTSPVEFTGKGARKIPTAGVLHLICLGLGLYMAI